MNAQDTFFHPKSSLNIKGKLVPLTSPLVMGILNITPDSFYDGNQLTSSQKIVDRAGEMLNDGAAMLDLGGYSSRPGAGEVSEAEETDRVVPAIEAVAAAFPEAVLSVDTFRSAVAQAGVKAGAGIINDISGGKGDDAMFATVAALRVPYILMHMQGTPQTMQLDPQYTDVMGEVTQFFAQQLEKLHLLGVSDILLDPGFGFGKTVEHNYTLLSRMDEFKILGKPILAGVSRKSMINRVLGTKPETALNGTTVANTIALMKGAAILRVHDVKEAVQAVKLVGAAFSPNIVA